jgi:uncharacterized protein YbaA (DUF1428 family)
MMITKDEYSIGNLALLEALEQNGKDYKRSLLAFREKVLSDPRILEEVIQYYFDGRPVAFCR